jgi:hypothetical protein
MSYEHYHENAQEETAKMLVTCSPATEFKWPARRGGHSCLPKSGSQPPTGLCAVAKPRTPQMANAAISLSAKTLIANARLENPATTRKQSIGIESNRERIEISRVCAFLVTRHSPLITAFLIETPRLEFPLTSIVTIASKFLIETK